MIALARSWASMDYHLYSRPGCLLGRGLSFFVRVTALVFSASCYLCYVSTFAPGHSTSRPGAFHLLFSITRAPYLLRHLRMHLQLQTHYLNARSFERMRPR
jgi:hypothetical protein